MLNFAKKIIDAELGNTHLFSVGQAGFIIKSPSGQLLGIDLYLSQCVERVEGHAGYKRLLPQILNDDELVFDCIVATHFHRDHFDVDSMKNLMADKKTKLFAAFDCKEDVDKLQISQKQTIFVKPKNKFNFGDFQLTFIDCDHGTGAPDAVGVIISVDNNKILVTGDTCLRLDRIDEYNSEGKIDILLAPINGAYGNMNEMDCVRLSQALRPSLTIPYHYGMFASHGGNPGLFYDLMNERDLSNLIMTMGECYTIPNTKN